MKKQYALALLLILAFGVVTTMAFELTTPETSIPDAYMVDSSTTGAKIDSVMVRPSKGGDRMMVTLGLNNMTSGNSYRIGVELMDGTSYYDLSDATVDPEANNSTSDYENGYYETSYTASGTTENLRINLDKDNIWLNVDGVMITLADA
jgi:predicted outer membrane lipoprotein